MNGITISSAADDSDSGNISAFTNFSTAVNSSSPFTIQGKTIQERREEARVRLATMLIKAMAGLILIAIIIGAGLLYLLPVEKFSAKDMLNLILAVGSVFSGLLGAAITFYFSAKV